MPTGFWLLSEGGWIGIEATSYTNWENSGLDGHIGGHYLSALSLMYASTGDAEIKSRLSYMLAELQRCQGANGNGYIGGVPGGKAIWEEIASGKIDAGGFSLNGKWVPLYNIHKTYAGLRDAYLVAGMEEAKEMLVKMTDWAIRLVSNLTEEQIQDMLRSEHGGLNETFADVAAITGDKKYLKLAHQFSHQLILNPLLRQQDELTGKHANTQIPKVIGFKRIADLEKNEAWDQAARYFWGTVVEHRSVSMGGNSVSEHFNPVNDFSRMISHIEGPETCNTHNMLRLTKMLYQTSKESRYIDYYERALYNHILSSQHPETGGLVYFTPMRPGHYRVYSQPHTSMWCCVGSGIENHGKYGELIYAHTADELYVNLFYTLSLAVEGSTNGNHSGEQLPRRIWNPDHGQPQEKKDIYFATPLSGMGRSGSPSNQGQRQICTHCTQRWLYSCQQEMEERRQSGGGATHADQNRTTSRSFQLLLLPVWPNCACRPDRQRGSDRSLCRRQPGGHIAHGRQVPLKNIPLVVGNPDQLASLVTPVTSKPLTFHLSGLYPGAYEAGMELIPFSTLHGSRYIIYWPQATAEEAEKIRLKMKQDEEKQLQLNTASVDKVVCGEQQPESDHFIASEKSNAGVFEDTRWREAEGRFSYQLKNNDLKGKYLYVAHFNNDRSRNFDILIDGERVKTLSLTGSKGMEPEVLILPVSEESVKKRTITVQFSAMPGSRTAKIIEVRLLSQFVEVPGARSGTIPAD